MEQAQRRRAVVATGVAAVLVAAAAVWLWPDGGHRSAQPPPVAVGASPSPSPSPSPTLPYPFFPPGTCLDHPQLSKVITTVEARPCEQSHDGEAIANVRLPEGLTSDAGIGRALRELCKVPLAEWDRRQGGGGPYYGFPFGPSLAFYGQGMRDATCAMTVSSRQEGRKLTGRLR
ncbi:hypothetical protein KNE206_14590 [Kitasatospora sp. NE20-6]|uniref:hypothetical protein n=1 Tax=Kitasatospora sp. NE20-6 TaxID=2859066 RepID=UPI0034DC8747